MQLFRTLPAMLQYMVNSYHNAYAFNYPIDGQWDRTSTTEFAEKVGRVALGLWKLGVKKGDTVGILGRPGTYSMIADMAVLTAGGVTVPLFPHISDKNFLYQVENAQIKKLIVIGGDYWSALADKRDLFDTIILYHRDEQQEAENILRLEEVMEMGDQVSQENPTLHADLREQVHEDDLAAILYTSSRAGTPKGVQLTHKNFISQVRGILELMGPKPRTDRVLSMLPLAHVFEKMLVYVYMAGGLSIYFVDDHKKLMNYFQEVKPTLSAMVPLILEKIHGKIVSTIQSKPWPISALGSWAMRFAQKPPGGFWSRQLAYIADKLIWRHVRETLGGHYRGILAGGAALNADLCQFYLNCGIPVFQGYGMTESCPVITTNYQDHNKPGTVGLPFPGVEVKITEEGEVIARGPNIMPGYHRDPEATKRRFDDEGWLLTGDRGEFDEHGFLKITGRIKEIMKTSAGKMVAPLPIEQMFCEHILVDLAMVVANERDYVTCLLFPNWDELKILKEKNNQSQISHEDFLDGPVVSKEIQQMLKKVNSQVNAWERVRVARFVSLPLSVERGELTPTLKINRELVTENYAEIIDSMY